MRTMRERIGVSESDARIAAPNNPGAAMEPRAATVSLSVAGDEEDPRLVPRRHHSYPY